VAILIVEKINEGSNGNSAEGVQVGFVIIFFQMRIIKSLPKSRRGRRSEL
jgi:hypothetical protein